MSLERKAKTASPQDSGDSPSPQLLEQIAVRAYYKAEARGFAQGHEAEDWFAAEAEQRASTAGA